MMMIMAFGFVWTFFALLVVELSTYKFKAWTIQDLQPREGLSMLKMS